MGIFGGRTQGMVPPATVPELARAVPAQSAELRHEAELMASASDRTLRGQFATIWPKDFVLPTDHDKRVLAVEGAIVAKDREDVADLMSRASRIGQLDDQTVSRTFGVPPLPRDQGHRLEAALDLAGREVEGFESPKVAAQRTLDRARAVREVLNIDRADADRFKDVSPLARLVWKHVPDLASRFGIPVKADEGYTPGDEENGNVGLSIHNTGSDSRYASRSRAGFSQLANKELDVLVGPEGSGGMVDRLVQTSSDRERRFSRQSEPARNVARDMSAAAFLSNIIGR